VRSRPRAPLTLSRLRASPTCQPLSLARSPSLADRPHQSAASSSSRTTHRRPLTAVPSIAVPSPIPSPHRKSSAPPRPHRLTNVLAQYCPAVESHRRRCATLMPALCTSPAPAELRCSTPLPSGAYKKVAPGTSFPAPAPATTLLPSPERNSRSAAVFPLSGEFSPPPLSPSLLVQQAIKLTEQLPHNAANSKHHFPAPVPRPKTTGGDPHREAPPPPRGQPPPGPL
jgi:hypothetical protein